MRTRRRTVRLRLTLLYVCLSLLSGTGLLLITYVLVANEFPAVYHQDQNGDGQIVRICSLPGAAYSTADGCAEQARALIDAQRAATLRQLLMQSGVALAVVTVASLGLGWLFAGRVLRPLGTITAAARRISANDLHERLAMAGCCDDEVTELAGTFDGLLARLDAAFTAQRQFVANASHELRTPLARQRTLVEVALADSAATAASLRAVCRRVLDAGAQQERLIDSLLVLARSERRLHRSAPLDLRALTDRVIALRRAEASTIGVRITAALDAAAVLGDRDLVERLVVNLVENAIRHNTSHGTVTVLTSDTRLTVRNTGPVIPPNELDRLFQPFHRLSRARSASGEGHGLGLAIVSAIAAAHQARLDARALPGGGLSIEVEFPACGTDEPDNAGHLPSTVG